jgi:aldose 1-epimerase
VTMALRLLPCPGYPFALELSVRYELDESGLTVTTAATNVGAAAAPYGTGMHPYLTVGTRAVDEAVLLLPARTRLTTGADQVPVGREPVAGTG